MEHSKHMSKEFDFPTFNTKCLAVLKVWEIRDFEFPAILPLNCSSEQYRKFYGKLLFVETQTQTHCFFPKIKENLLVPFAISILLFAFVIVQD